MCQNHKKSTIVNMLYGSYIHEKDNAQYAFCDCCACKEDNYFCSALSFECESSECLLLFFWQRDCEGKSC